MTKFKGYKLQLACCFIMKTGDKARNKNHKWHFGCLIFFILPFICLEDKIGLVFCCGFFGLFLLFVWGFFVCNIQSDLFTLGRWVGRSYVLSSECCCCSYAHIRGYSLKKFFQVSTLRLSIIKIR